MKHYFSFFIFTLILASCGTDGHHFKLEGQFQHLNQGEFYVYSPDGTIEGFDTLRLNAGKFSHEFVCERPGIIMVVFPNFYEQPIFAEPGKTVKMKGEATHLKELTVKGTELNEQMNSFRQQVLHSTPKETAKAAKQFITENPQSLVSVHLLNKYFLQAEHPDYATTRKLVKLLAKQQPSKYLDKLLSRLKDWNSVQVGDKLPRIEAIDTQGKKVDGKRLSDAPLCVITAWAAWNYISLSQQRIICQLQNQYPGKLEALGICLEPDTLTCGKTMRRERIEWPNICDCKMLDSPYFRQLGFNTVPDNLILVKGKVVGRSLSSSELRKKLEEHLSKETSKNDQIKSQR